MAGSLDGGTMADEFFVIGCSADGTTFDGPLSKETLEKRLAENYYGSHVTFATKNPGTDGFCIRLKGELLIIKGSIVQPAAESVVTRWRL
jgi:hypothetical protein